MRIGSADGPGKEQAHKSTHVIYDTRSGHIVATHYFIDAAPSPERQRVNQLLKDAHEKSRVPLDHLAILTNPDFPHGEGEMRADHAQSRLVRSGVAPRSGSDLDLAATLFRRALIRSCCHSRASGNPAAREGLSWMPAFAGKTGLLSPGGDPVSSQSQPDPRSARGSPRARAPPARRRCRARSSGRSGRRAAAGQRRPAWRRPPRRRHARQPPRSRRPLRERG